MPIWLFRYARTAATHMAPTYKWQFTPRFRRHAFGWKSDTAIPRIKEAVSEIKAVSKKEPALGAEGAVLFLEKLVPAIEDVDSSSGALGAAVGRAIEMLVPVIAAPAVGDAVRATCLERLWRLLEHGDLPYLDYIEEFWGTLCATPDVASAWADALQATFLPPDDTGHYRQSPGMTACLSALLAAGRHDELLALIARWDFPHWHHRAWGAKALAAAGKRAEAIAYAEASKGPDAPLASIAAFCECVLIEVGLTDEAYARFALDATSAGTNLATFKAIVKKYPQVSKKTVLRDLVARQPGQEGKWFAAAKDAGLFDLAIELANRSPSDPRTLIRASRDYGFAQPAFAMEAGMTALHGIASGWGYDITNFDLLEAYMAMVSAAGGAGIERSVVNGLVQTMIAAHPKDARFLAKVLAPQLARA